MHHDLPNAAVMRFLGHQVPVRSAGQRRFKARPSDRIERHEGSACATGWESMASRIYDKFAQLLRVETTLNAPEVFKSIVRTQPKPP